MRASSATGQRLLQRWHRMLFLIFVAFVGLVLASCSPGKLGAAYLARQIKARPAEYDGRIEHHVVVRVFDGTQLAADIFHPIGPKAAPTILVRLPYSKTPYNQLAATTIGTLWAERGYTAVIQGTRG